MAKKKVDRHAPQKMQLTEDFIDTCIWASTRYFVGRSTIAASMHAKEIAQFLDLNSQIISGDRRRFLAQDIRKEITDKIRWYDNVEIDGYPTNKDALTMICEWLVAYLKAHNTYINQEGRCGEGGFDPSNLKFRVDFTHNKVSVEELDSNDRRRARLDVPNALIDYVPWIKLAGWLDPQGQLLLEHKGEQILTQAFEFPIHGRYQGEEHDHLIMGYCGTEQFIENPFVDCYCIEEAILRNTISQTELDLEVHTHE